MTGFSSAINRDDEMNVIKSWNAIKRRPEYTNHSFSVSVFKKFLELCPEQACRVLALDPDENLVENPRFHYVAHALCDMFNVAISFLGGDLNPLEDDLIELGRRHVSFGVKAEFFEPLGRALIYGFKQVFGDEFTQRQEESWKAIYGLMSSQMKQGIRREENRRQVEKQKTRDRIDSVKEKAAFLQRASPAHTTTKSYRASSIVSYSSHSSTTPDFDEMSDISMEV